MSFLARFFTAVGLLKKKANVLVVGLDNSGKSTVVHWLKPESEIPKEEIIPTVGFTVEQFSRQKIDFTVFDMSGQGRYRTLWEHYYPDAEAILFVMDTTDKVRAGIAREELDAMLNHRAIKSRPVPILVLANKMDIEGGMTASECSEALGLERIREKPWYICACSAISGDGLSTGLDWLVERL